MIPAFIQLSLSSVLSQTRAIAKTYGVLGRD